MILFRSLTSKCAMENWILLFRAMSMGWYFFAFQSCLQHRAEQAFCESLCSSRKSSRFFGMLQGWLFQESRICVLQLFMFAQEHLFTLAQEHSLHTLHLGARTGE